MIMPFRWMSWDLPNGKSTLVQVMAWCRQATSHYLSQCWPRSVSPYGVTRAQWVNCLIPQRWLKNSCSVSYPRLNKALANERRRYMCDVSSHLPRPCSATDRKRSQVSELCAVRVSQFVYSFTPLIVPLIRYPPSAQHLMASNTSNFIEQPTVCVNCYKGKSNWFSVQWIHLIGESVAVFVNSGFAAQLIRFAETVSKWGLQWRYISVKASEISGNSIAWSRAFSEYNNNNKGNIKAPHYGPFVRGIPRPGAKGTVISNAESGGSMSWRHQLHLVIKIYTVIFWCVTWGRLNKKMSSYQYRDPHVLKIRRSQRNSYL